MTPPISERIAVLETKLDGLEGQVDRIDTKVDALDSKLDTVLLELAKRPATPEGLTVSNKTLALLLPLAGAIGAGILKLATVLAPLFIG